MMSSTNICDIHHVLSIIPAQRRGIEFLMFSFHSIAGLTFLYSRYGMTDTTTFLL